MRIQHERLTGQNPIALPCFCIFQNCMRNEAEPKRRAYKFTVTFGKSNLEAEMGDGDARAASDHTLKVRQASFRDLRGIVCFSCPPK